MLGIFLFSFFGNDYHLHKMAYGVLGSLMGALSSQDPRSGALAGTIGGIASEVIAEAVLESFEDVTARAVAQAENQGKVLDKDAFLNLYADTAQAQKAANVGKLGAVFVTLLAQQDVEIGIKTATNAVENNCISPIVLGGIMPWEAYDLYKTYVTEGPEAAAKKLGFTVGTAVIGGVAIKGAFKLGAIVAPTAAEALTAYMAAHPTFAKCYALVSAALSKGVEKYHAADAALSKAATKAWSKVSGKAVGQVERKTSGAALEKLGLNPKYWTTEVEFQGNKVYQRKDLIDPCLINPKERVKMNNLERMLNGLAPYGPDGSKIELHHMLQTHDGPLAEVTRTFHNKNSRIIHINPSNISSGIDRNAFDQWRKAYWKHRAKDFEATSGQ